MMWSNGSRLDALGPDNLLLLRTRRAPEITTSLRKFFPPTPPFLTNSSLTPNNY